jgi:UDP-glucose 4-epimerase
MKVVVTGAAGSLGSHLCERLVADGHLVTGLDDLSAGRVAHLAEVRRRKGFALHHLDVTQPLVAAAVARELPEVVVHLAPVLAPDLLDSAHALGARVVLASGASGYGGTTQAVTERHGSRPRTLAGAHHVSAEAHLHAWQARGLAGVALRFTTLYGPRSRGVVATWARALLAGTPTWVHGDGRQVRDLLYVDDAVDAVLRCLGGRADGRRLNVGTGVGTTVRDLHTVVAAAVGVADAPSYRAAPVDDLRSVLVDPGSARRALGWEPVVGLAEGVARTVDALRR